MYFGSVVNQINTIEQEIKEKLIAGNKDFYANQKLFQSKLRSRKSKLKFYWTLITLIVNYATGTLVLKENSIQKLTIFERKALRNLFGPTKELNGKWRIKINEELDELIQQKIIIRFIKSQRLKWLGRMERIPKEREVTRIYKCKPFAYRPIGIPKNKLMWERTCRQ
jgi:hypothetical protein